ncbi:hypothetical protein GCM10023195_69720 [Actinoallomurus liliacearum]|uniref:Uncharacterized protein n=1 Tax=Actinoallomurus liliacearum TaxID=1080073 RepID=A0ABP8TY20_9ACTN
MGDDLDEPGPDRERPLLAGPCGAGDAEKSDTCRRSRQTRDRSRRAPRHALPPQPCDRPSQERKDHAIPQVDISLNAGDWGFDHII